MSQHGCPERLSSRSKNYVDDGNESPTMGILVETLTGTAFDMTVSPADTVFAIKSKIFRVEGIPISQQHLVYGHRELEDSRTLRSLRIGHGARLRLVLSMRGGPISTRRVPPPPSHQPDKHWRDIERLLDANRDENPSWSGSSSGSGCKVTLLVFKDGDKLNMLRVRDNQDGTFSPLTTENYSSSLKSLVEDTSDDGLSGSVQENAVTMGKMMDLRRRMEALTVTKRPLAGQSSGIQKTRSEESLPLSSLREEHDVRYHGAFSHHLSTLPPIGSRSESERAVCDTRLGGTLLDTQRLTSLDHNYGGILGRESGLSELLSSSTSELDTLRRPRALPALSSLSPLPPLPPLSPLSPLSPLPALSRHHNTEHLHLSDDMLHYTHKKRHNLDERTQKRVNDLPNMEHSRLFGYDNFISSEEREVEKESIPKPSGSDETNEGKGAKKTRIRCSWCGKRLSIATRHSCRCGRVLCAPHRYAEAHDCTHDYKTHAQVLPVVSAPKLPKI